MKRLIIYRDDIVRGAVRCAAPPTAYPERCASADDRRALESARASLAQGAQPKAVAARLERHGYKVLVQ